MNILGIDMGSREVKIVIYKEDKIIYKNKISTMSFYRDYCEYDEKLKVNIKKITNLKIDRAVSTGYGKNNTDLSDFVQINEIKAHAYGAMHQLKEDDFILLDVGGQDVKAIKIEKGIVTDLDLNDKCAASCGRYLENMANVLEVTLETMSSHTENPINLNSTCAVFSESELIGKIAEGVSVERLCAGVNYSMYKRLRPLLSKFLGKKLVVSGGVAKNNAIRDFLKQDYNEVITLDMPEFNGAIGCCIYANNRFGGK
ncbi:acyl-CoA dehydratase activase [Helicovermis profundi]|uniref:Acyl-CoA dehydratase activase n=1 Tax=Helicovermis profundi TaxID=3065157 RepID=A0AAU9ELG3_9FIRM|nr:acyl-CoA dehydratase activase [Clostridia bacterium S502]